MNCNTIKVLMELLVIFLIAKIDHIYIRYSLCIFDTAMVRIVADGGCGEPLKL